MSTPVTTLTDNVVTLPQRAEAVTPAGRLADADLDRWANRLARLLLSRGATAGTRIVVAVDPWIEAMVADAAVHKLGAVPVSAASGARIGVTTRDRRPALSDAIDWLVLDDRSTLRQYLVTSDAPLSVTDPRAVA